MHKWLVKPNHEESSNVGKYPSSRSMEEYLRKGIIILDKPRGPTSHVVDHHIKKITGIEKLSHGGRIISAQSHGLGIF